MYLTALLEYFTALLFYCPIRLYDCSIRLYDCSIRVFDCPIEYLTALLEYFTALLFYCLIRLYDCSIRVFDCSIRVFDHSTRVYQKISPFKIRVDGALAPATPSCYASVCLLVKMHFKGKDQHTLINSQLPECSIRVSDCSIKIHYTLIYPTLVYLKPEMTALLEYFEYRCMLY